MSFYLKDPAARVDYAIDWAGQLDGRTIAASNWSVEPDEQGGIAAENASVALSLTSARLTGGVTGHAYSVSNLVTLSDGSADVRSITLRVEEK
jgi:cytosine/adenosine deaminase-related metal-dependent hydrolase